MATAFQTDAELQVQSLISGSQIAIDRLWQSAVDHKAQVGVLAAHSVQALQATADQQRAQALSVVRERQAALSNSLDEHSQAMSTESVARRPDLEMQCGTLSAQIDMAGQTQADAIRDAGATQSERAVSQIEAQASNLRAYGTAASGRYRGGDKGQAQSQAAQRVASAAQVATRQAASPVRADASAGAEMGSASILNAAGRAMQSLIDEAAPAGRTIAGTAQSWVDKLSGAGAAAFGQLESIGDACWMPSTSSCPPRSTAAARGRRCRASDRWRGPGRHRHYPARRQ
jgi:hypothetical protein